MNRPELTVVTDDEPGLRSAAATAGPPPATGPAAAAAPAGGSQVVPAGVLISSGRQDDAVESALSVAAADPARVDDLLDALSAARLWLPLPGSGPPVTDGSGVRLPTVTYLGRAFVPAYSSAARLLRASEGVPRGERVTVIPHIVVRAADLARRLPPGLGIALNPGAAPSVPIYPPGVAELAAERAAVGGRQVRVGPLPEVPGALLAAIGAWLSQIPAVRQAAAAWLAVEGSGEGLVISVVLDDPGDHAVRDAAVTAVQDAVTAAGGARYPVDVAFPGEVEPDLIDRWVTSSATPFYQRQVGLPAPRPATP